MVFGFSRCFAMLCYAMLRRRIEEFKKPSCCLVMVDGRSEDMKFLFGRKMDTECDV